MPAVTPPLLSPEFLAQLERLELVSRKVFRGRMKGERRSKRKGQSVEFADFRNYSHGDDLRFIDWNTYARLDKLFLKMFFEEEDLHFYTLIDASSSMDFGEPTKLQYAKQLAAALGFIGLVRADRVKIETLGQSPKVPGPVLRGRASLWRLLKYLEEIQPNESVPLAQGVKNFCLRNSGKGIVVLISDLMDKNGYQDALRYLMAQQMDAYVIQVLSREEIDPDVKGDLRLVDVEDGDVAEITVSAPLLNRYKQTLNAFVDGARDFCNRRGMSYLLANNQTPVDQLVTQLLAQERLGALMWPSWLGLNLLSWWQWGLLAAVPPAVVLLYFLKLKRVPLEVPSTYLWHKSIEDMHVNSIWQKLRKSLLLFLQLLLLLLAALALFRPSWNANTLAGSRFIFLIDASASMAANDVKPTRLEEAKLRSLAQIDRMDSDAVAMIVSFSDTARVEQPFTGNRKQLRHAVEGIKQTNRVTNMKEALQVASGLANPGRSATDMTDTQVAEALPAELKIYSDGGLERVQDFSLGNLEPEFFLVGEAVYKEPKEPDPTKRGPLVKWADNVGVTAFSTRRKEGKPLELEAFTSLENFGPLEATVELELLLDGQLVDARNVTVPTGESTPISFDLGEVISGVLEVRAKTGDALAIDDAAWTTINPPRKAKVLLVTLGDEALEIASSDLSQSVADVTVEKPAYLLTTLYKDDIAKGKYGLIIYDRCQPEAMPPANTFFLGALPPDKTWSAKEKAAVPQIIDTERSHPLMQLIEMGDVIIVEGTPLAPPQGSTVLIDTHVGPLFAIAPREGYEDAVMGFPLVSGDQVITNWPVKLSFPVFVRNVLQYLGGSRDPLSAGNIRPGQSIPLTADGNPPTIEVRTPDKRTVQVARGNLNAYNFNDTERPGVYEVLSGKDVAQQFSVNLFYPPESDIKPKDIQIGHTELTGKQALEPVRREGWRWLLLAGLAVLLFEWWVYNRRVYL